MGTDNLDDLEGTQALVVQLPRGAFCPDVLGLEPYTFPDGKLGGGDMAVISAFLVDVLGSQDLGAEEVVEVSDVFRYVEGLAFSGMGAGVDW